MTDSTRLLHDDIETPLGLLTLVADHEGSLHALGWYDGHDRMAHQLGAYATKHGTLTRASDPFGLSTALRAYFAGDLNAIDALPTAGQGTPFQRAVWRALRDIPCGETRSYGD